MYKLPPSDILVGGGKGRDLGVVSLKPLNFAPML